MPPRTRKVKAEVEETEESVELDDVHKNTLPVIDSSYARTFTVVKEGTLANSKIYLIRHPKKGSALFRVSKDHLDEVLSVDDGHRSWFYGESVIEDGSVRLFAPYHPLFVTLPYLWKNKSKFLELEEIMNDEELPSICELMNNEQLKKTLELVSDVKEISDTMVYRFNEEKTLSWISKKFESLKSSIRNEVHKALLECKESFDRHVFSLLNDFISSEISELARTHLDIKEAETSENVDMSMKRKRLDEDDEIPKHVVKKPRESLAVKKLQQASKGTKSISNFFTKK